jgi:hypothetical protein
MSDLQATDKPTVRQTTCSRCGTVFGCGVETGGCWCAAEPYRLPMPAPHENETCWCPACLRAEYARQMAAQ